MKKEKTAPVAPEALAPVPVLALEKIPSAALRMGISVSQFYRIAKPEGLRIVRVTGRATAVLQSDVDNWINERIKHHLVGEKGATR